MYKYKKATIKFLFATFTLVVCLVVLNIDNFALSGERYKDILRGNKEIILNYEVKENNEKKGEFHIKIKKEKAATFVEAKFVNTSILKYIPFYSKDMLFEVGEETKDYMSGVWYLQKLLVWLWIKGNDKQRVVDFKDRYLKSSYQINISPVIKRFRPHSKIPVQCPSNHYVSIYQANNSNQRIMLIYLLSKKNRIPVYVKGPGIKWELCLTNTYEHKKVDISDEELLALAQELDILKDKKGVIKDPKIVTKKSSDYPLLEYKKRCPLDDDQKKEVAMEIIKSRLSSIEQGITPGHKIIKRTDKGYYVEVAHDDVIDEMKRKLKDQKRLKTGVYDSKQTDNDTIYYCEIPLSGTKLADKEISIEKGNLYKWNKESIFHDLHKE